MKGTDGRRPLLPLDIVDHIWAESDLNVWPKRPDYLFIELK